MDRNTAPRPAAATIKPVAARAVLGTGAGEGDGTGVGAVSMRSVWLDAPIWINADGDSDGACGVEVKTDGNGSVEKREPGNHGRSDADGRCMGRLCTVHAVSNESVQEIPICVLLIGTGG